MTAWVTTLLSGTLQTRLTKEMLRNDEIFAIQGNRNPFVDHPEWVSVLYLTNEAPEEVLVESAFLGPSRARTGRSPSDLPGRP